MIVHLTGTLVACTASAATLDVGGVGYELGISATCAQELPPVGTERVTILTRLVVREDNWQLFGFVNADERRVFDRLCAISGVGPRMALSVLSTFTPAALAAVVASRDEKAMARVPGIGKKKASRLVLELQGIVDEDLISADLSQVPRAAEPVPATGPASEATEALLSMGFTTREIELALSDAPDGELATPEAALAFALRRLGGGR